MSIQTEIDRIETAKAAIGTAIAGKGVAVPSGTKLDGMAALINGIEQGGGGEVDAALLNRVNTLEIKVRNLAEDLGALQIEIDELGTFVFDEFPKIWVRMLAIEKHLNIQKPEGTQPPIADEELEGWFE